ncbi:DUF4254 domain-containing protein [Flavobacteriaceae bacterium]|nr:DUF4254 domain-containing protein [Flavobacteriaceae bacterium]MDA7797988.1 DUF4254 domain-containing protein [bacterium]MDA8630724.1 DUF4254 domain-containing protein [Flavobacteriaceae bacterium]MDA8703820.1 DUF4254 domain-containing protein [Flavobacteriaceae bacterium]MDA9084126.1 DUF4254 domain-containing protein [Flavobacteriaceae bacterium]
MIKTNISKLAIEIFEKSVNDYHIHDDINRKSTNPFEMKSFEHLLYEKNWIDTVQWHYEDIIRDPEIDPNEGMKLKRMIDSSNQNRTEMVEYIDSYFLELYSNATLVKNARINSESPAWAMDRLSILILKIYHMDEESKRVDVSEKHRNNCQAKLDVLLDQKTDLSESIDQLLEDISSGQKKMKVYKQMKMYNDESLNPVLYKKDDSKKG